jgi:hypothetical protein
MSGKPIPNLRESKCCFLCEHYSGAIMISGASKRYESECTKYNFIVKVYDVCDGYERSENENI